FQEPAICLSLLLQIAGDGDPAILDYQYLLAALLNVAQQMGRQKDVSLAAVPDLAYQVDHALTSRRVQPIGGLVKKNQTRAVHYRLRQLRQLLHAQRVRAELSVSGFSQADVKQRLVRALERRL